MLLLSASNNFNKNQWFYKVLYRPGLVLVLMYSDMYI